ARLPENPQLQARRFFETVSHPLVGSHAFPTLPLQSASPWYSRPAPTLGQHTEEVLRELLGLDESALAALRAAGIIGTHPVGLCPSDPLWCRGAPWRARGRRGGRPDEHQCCAAR